MGRNESENELVCDIPHSTSISHHRGTHGFPTNVLRHVNRVARQKSRSTPWYEIPRPYPTAHEPHVDTTVSSLLRL